jgi:hypothetical protein
MGNCIVHMKFALLVLFQFEVGFYNHLVRDMKYM